MNENKNPQPTNLATRLAINRWGHADQQIFKLQQANPQAEFAISLMKHFGVVAGKPAGEDSAGRQKGELLTPFEVVNRACQIADIGWQEFQKRGWILDIPVPPVDQETNA